MNLHDLVAYLEKNVRPGFAKQVTVIKKENLSKATNEEEIFSKEILNPCIRKFFMQQRNKIGLEDSDVEKGLGSEGFKSCKGFSYTPARKKKHIFRKNDFVKNSPPIEWYKSHKGTLPVYQACPDFAISDPLPFSVVGEVKYFKGKTPDSAVKELYNAARQAAFYIAAYEGLYKNALLVIADTTPLKAFKAGLDMIRPELLERFGEETGIYLCVLYDEPVV